MTAAEDICRMRGHLWGDPMVESGTLRKFRQICSQCQTRRISTMSEEGEVIRVRFLRPIRGEEA